MRKSLLRRKHDRAELEQKGRCNYGSRTKGARGIPRRKERQKETWGGLFEGVLDLKGVESLVQEGWGGVYLMGVY